jgi:hypothetical protein
MKIERAFVFAVGAAALLAVNAVSASAQARSTKPIPIRKDAAPARVDTVTIYRTDTLRMQGRVDTVRIAARPRVDTVRVNVRSVDTVRLQPPPPPPIVLGSGFYIGAGGGVYAPAGALFNPNSAGPSGQLQLGWQGLDRPIGIRVDANYAKPGEDALYSGLQADPEVLNFSADITLGIPSITQAFGLSARFTPYILGGGTYTKYKNLPIRLNPGLPGGVPPANVTAGNPAWQSNGGFNVGLGGGWTVGRAQIFVESRLMAFHPSNTPQARQFPSIVGINWF